MKLLQIKVNDNLKRAIDEKSERYGVSASSLVRIILVQSFLDGSQKTWEPGNIFNADRDNYGRPIHIDDLIKKL